MEGWYGRMLKCKNPVQSTAHRNVNAIGIEALAIVGSFRKFDSHKGGNQATPRHALTHGILFD